MITREDKQALLKQFARTESDCGSSEVQIALLSQRIYNISMHLRTFKKDFHSQQGLLKLIGQRKSFLRYLKRTNLEMHDQCVATLKSKGLM